MWVHLCAFPSGAGGPVKHTEPDKGATEVEENSKAEPTAAGSTSDSAQGTTSVPSLWLLCASAVKQVRTLKEKEKERTVHARFGCVHFEKCSLSSKPSETIEGPETKKTAGRASLPDSWNPSIASVPQF
eukprot:1141171-Pelagomonas_calceolata.AAC.2